MAKKKLTGIAITPIAGGVGLSLTFDGAVDAEHYPLSLSIAAQLRDKLTQACNLVGVQHHPTGDGVGVSDFCAMSIQPPQEYQQ